MFIIEHFKRIRGEQQKPARIVGYVNNVIPRFTTKQYTNHFRMVSQVFEILENRLGPSLSNVEFVRRPMIPVRTQLLATIWFLSTDSFRSVSEKFNLGKSSLNDCVRRVVRELNSIANEIIRWPTGPNLIASKEKFMCIGDAPLPGVVAAIDGSYICIYKETKH